MAKDIKFNIRLNIDGKNVIVQASENVKELQRNIMGAKQATTDERKSGGGPELAQRVEQGADGQRGRVYEGRHNAYTRAEQSSFNPLTRGATAIIYVVQFVEQVSIHAPTRGATCGA